MRVGLLISAAAALLPMTSSQAAPPKSDDKAIVVTGVRDSTGRPIPMSDWHVAETDHVLVYSRGETGDLERIAANLEKLHFLLSMLFDRVDAPDNVVKLKVTMFGDTADFDHLDLRNIRWQQGPYPRDFTTRIYYDPREDGAVMATPRAPQKIVFQRGVPLSSIDLTPFRPASLPGGSEPPTNSLGLSDSGAKDAGEVSQEVTAESRLYSGFAQHYLLTYFPAAYPRWYLQGFGEIFSTLNADAPGTIQYGQVPAGYRDAQERYGRYPLKRILDGTYLNDKRWFPAFTPYQAWALAHLLFFSEEWKAPLHNYLAAVAKGAPPETAAAALGDLDALQRQLAEYHGSKVPFEQLTYPANRITRPILRQLREGEAKFIRGRLQLGARVDMAELAADPGGGDLNPATPAESGKNWLQELRQDAGRYPREAEAQLLLAEGECRSGNSANCLGAAERALNLAPQNASGLTWKGVALTQEAIAGPAAEREARLKQARSFIVQANHADTEAVLPLLAYYHSYSDAGLAAPTVAVDGLQKATEMVPASPGPRLMLGSELVQRGDPVDARRTLLPLAKGPFDSPEKPKAEALLSQLPER